MTRLFLARQPIIDREGKIFAYELLFRTGFSGEAEIENGKQATFRVIDGLISSFGNVLKNRKGFVNIDQTSDILSVAGFLPSNKIGFEILETSVFSGEFLDDMVRLKEMGYELSLDDFTYSEKLIPYLKIVDYVKIDTLGQDREGLKEILRLVKRFGVKTVAEKVETYEMFRVCFERGFDYFQGYFFQEPQILSSKTVEPHYTALISLYNLLSREAEVKEVEKVFKRFSDLSVKLLQLLNSAYYSLRQPLRSIRHAILMLGYKNLMRWVLILMYSLRTEDFTSDPLFEEASIRGFFMERLAKEVFGNKEISDKAFITGVLSLVDVLLCVPKEEVLRSILVEEEIREAVLKRSGPLGDLLTLVECVQRGNLRAVLKIVRSYDLSLQRVLEIQTQALQDYASLDL